MRPKYLVLLEDDHLQSETIVDALRRKYRAVKVEAVATEKEFVQRVDEFVKKPPDAFILDIMVRWTDPSPDEPAKTLGADFFRAGLRCEERLRKNGCKVPVIFYSVVSHESIEKELPKNNLTRLISKESTYESLYSAVETSLNART